MDNFWQGISLAILAVIVGLALRKQGAEMATILMLAACAMVGVMAFSYMKPVVSFVQRMQNLGGFDQALFGPLLKAVGVGLVTEFAALVCADAGNSALGKLVGMLGTAVMIWLCLPIFEKMLDLIEGIMEKV